MNADEDIDDSACSTHPSMFLFPINSTIIPLFSPHYLTNVLLFTLYRPHMANKHNGHHFTAKLLDSKYLFYITCQHEYSSILL